MALDLRRRSVEAEVRILVRDLSRATLLIVLRSNLLLVKNDSERLDHYLVSRVSPSRIPSGILLAKLCFTCGVDPRGGGTSTFQRPKSRNTSNRTA